MDVYILKFDGCSKGNPGPAGAGSVIYKNDLEMWSKSEYLNIQTNNYAEYMGLINGLKYAVANNIKHLQVYGDSMLVIKQMTHVYKVKSENLLKLYNKAQQLSSQITDISFHHIYRENNTRADELANKQVVNKN